MARSFVLPIPFLAPTGGAGLRRAAVACVLAALFAARLVTAQAITIDSQGRAKDGTSSDVDRRFAQIEPTHVSLPPTPLGTRTRLELVRILEAEQGFAMRPLPKGHKGLTLVANGKLEPAGEPYLSMVTAAGLCAKPGDRVVITDLKFDKNKIVFMLNGGPDAKHRFLRHVQIGAGPTLNPVVRDDGQEPQGARITLSFKDHVPEMTGADVKALLAPLISFDVKTPIQAFTDTLPPKLKDAILGHQVMVGMSTEMVLFALGQPESKSREMEGQMPFEEWIYGKPPQPIEFVRINGNRVIRLEVAKVGEPPQIFTKDEVAGLMRTDGSPLTADVGPRAVKMGDVTRNPDTEAAAAPPTLRKEGESLPQDTGRDPQGTMRPVRFPTQKPQDEADSSADAAAESAPAKTDAKDAPPAPAADAGK